MTSLFTRFDLLFQIFFWSLMAVGAGCLFFKEFVMPPRRERRAPLWSLTALNTVWLIWALVTSVLLMQTVVAHAFTPWGLGLPDLPAWRCFFDAFSFHGPILIVGLVGAFSHWGWPAPSGPNHPHVWSAGLWAYIMALPIMWLGSAMWMGLLKIPALLGFQTMAPPQPLVDLIQETQGLLPLLALGFMAIIIAPLSEEILFRAGLYRLLKQVLSPKLASVVTALIFSVIHFNTLSFIPLVLLGLLLSEAYEATGSIRTSFVFHAAFNAQNFICILVDPASIQSL